MSTAQKIITLTLMVVGFTVVSVDFFYLKENDNYLSTLGFGLIVTGMIIFNYFFHWKKNKKGS